MKAQVERAEHRVGQMPAWHEAIADELQAVEQCLLKCIGADVPTVYELSKHLVKAGGKRLRPAIMILSALAASFDYAQDGIDPSTTLRAAKSFDYAQDGNRSAHDGSGSAQDGVAVRRRLIPIASAVELIHMASLVHDDVIDNSESRRGIVTANAFWGNKVSVLSGDCMLAKAFSLLAQDGDQRVMSVIADMTNKMSESEVLQALCEGEVEMWREHYWQIIRHKTAGFFSACCRGGAIIAGATPEVEDALADFGTEIGLAFQLTDDLLDIIGDPAITGKPTGNDVRDGKATLPVLLALDSLPEPQQIQLHAMIESKNLTADETEAICDIVRSTGAIQMTRDQARNYAERAASRLAVLRSSATVDNLTLVASQIIERMS